MSTNIIYLTWEILKNIYTYSYFMFITFVNRGYCPLNLAKEPIKYTFSSHYNYTQLHSYHSSGCPVAAISRFKRKFPLLYWHNYTNLLTWNLAGTFIIHLFYTLLLASFHSKSILIILRILGWSLKYEGLGLKYLLFAPIW